MATSNGSGAGGDIDDDLETAPSGDDLDSRSLAASSSATAAGPSTISISKSDPDGDATPSSVESTPDLDIEPEPSLEPTQPPRRKGGRKPIYATSEERKQRNRQAQAAFRERRTEYIKQLEASIKQHEDTISSLQQSHRSAADECLMLRYKNSLLERVLLEKGIDVQAELQMKAGSPLGLQHPAANIPQIPQPPLQRTTVQRQHARRSGQGFLPRVAPGQGSQDLSYQSSIQGHPTPSSHASSPTSRATRSPMMLYQSGNTPPTSAVSTQPPGSQFSFSSTPQPTSAGSTAFFATQQAQQHQMSPSMHRSLQQQSQHSTPTRFQNAAAIAPTMSGVPNLNAVAAATASAYYPSPFQKHIDQLELEYDAQETRAMLDGQPDGEDGMHITSPDRMQTSYPPGMDRQQQDRHQRRNFYPPNQTSLSQTQQGMPFISPNMQQHSQSSEQKFDARATNTGAINFASHPAQSAIPEAFSAMDIDPDDPMLSADPFGLSASMHYPTAYSFEPGTTLAQQQIQLSQAQMRMQQQQQQLQHIQQQQQQQPPHG